MTFYRQLRLLNTARIFIFLFVLIAIGGCAVQKEVIKLTADGMKSTEAEIDEDAFQLLPSGAIAWWRLDAAGLYESKIGPSLLSKFETALAPVLDAGLDLEQDVEVLLGGVYATAGSDVIVVAQGRYKLLQIELALRESAKEGDFFVAHFASEEMYVFDEIAAAFLSERTMVFGSQLGVRRVLERVEEGRLKRAIPAWFDKLLSKEAAQFQFGMDLDAQAVPAAFRTQAGFLQNLRAAQLVGNFRSPGVNIAGTLTYDSPAHAERAVEQVLEFEKDLGKYQLLLTALQISQPIRSLDANPTGKGAQVVARFDGSAVASILDNAAQFFGDTDGTTWLPN